MISRSFSPVAPVISVLMRKPLAAAFAAIILVIGLVVVLTSQTAHSTGYVTMYSTSDVPDDPSEADASAVELGVQFTVSKNGTIVGARFYKGSDNSGVHTATLWSSSGRKLASGSFVDETAVGWQTVMFNEPVAVSARTGYVISYHTDAGYYAQEKWQFTSGGTVGNSLITGTQGVFSYGSESSFPTNSWADAGYYVDALFDPNGTASDASVPAHVSTPPATSEAPTTPSTPTSSAPATIPTTPTAPTAQPTDSTGQPTGISKAPSPTPDPSTTTSAQPSATAPAAPTASPPASASSSGAWPGPDNTGVPAGTALTARSGDLTITTPNTVISGIDLSGCLNVEAANVIVKNSRIRGDCNYVVGSYSTGLVIQDSEVDGLNSSGAEVGIGYAGFTAIRVNVHGSQDGINANGNVVIQDSWIHDLHEANSSHNDGIQITEGSNVTIRHNTVENNMDETSAIMIGADQGDVSGVLVENNLLAGGGFALYGGAEPPAGNSIAAITLRNNAFSVRYYPQCGAYGPITAVNDGRISNTGEYWFETGLPIG